MAALLLAVRLPSAARAQTSAQAPTTATATVRGVVRGRDQRPIADAHVTFAAESAQAVSPASDLAFVVTDTAGRFVLAVPAGIAGTLVVEASGFEPDRTPLAPRSAGSDGPLITIRLARRARLDTVTVSATKRPLLNTSDAATGGAVDRLDLASLPSDARDPVNIALTIPGVARGVGFFDFAPPIQVDGANSLYTPYLVDGMDNTEGYLGGDKVEMPIDALEQIDVKTAGYGAELGRSANGVIEYTTRRGGDSWHGSATVTGRPGSDIDAKPAFTPAGDDHVGFRRLQLAASGGGPLITGSTHVFGAAEYINEDVSQPLAFGDPAFGGGVGNLARRRLKLFGRIDEDWSPTETTTIESGFSTISLVSQGGGIITPEADQTQDRNGLFADLRQTSHVGGWTNTAAIRAETYHYYYPPSASEFTTPNVTIIDNATDQTPLAVVGAPGFLFDEHEFDLEFKNTLARDIGSHHLSIGVDVIRAQHSLNAANANPSGSYTVLDSGITRTGPYVSIHDIPSDVPVYSYTADVNPQSIKGMQVLTGLFVEDAWLPTPKVTVNMGLRWDYDDLTAKGGSTPQLDNFQPRASVNWRVTKNDVVRGGAGIYVGTIPFTTFFDAKQFAKNGDNLVTFTNPNFGFGQGPTPAQIADALATEPPREIRELYARGARDPQSYQVTGGYQHEFPHRWAVSVDGIVVGTKYLPRIWDLNADSYIPSPGDTTTRSPAFGDAHRPFGAMPGSFRFLTTTDFGGQSIYYAMVMAIRHQFSDHWSADLSWTWSRTRDNTEDVNFAAEYANDFHNEWADAVSDRRHRIVGRAIYVPWAPLQLSTILSYETGTPYNVIAPIGTDFTGSVNYQLTANSFDYNYQRYPGTPRNSGRLPDEFNQDIGVQFTLPLPSGRLAIRADLINIWNYTNISGFVNNLPGGGPRTQFAGSPVTYDAGAGGPMRSFQFGGVYSL